LTVFSDIGLIGESNAGNTNSLPFEIAFIDWIISTDCRESGT
jgi:hypothetical protein